MGSRAAVPVLQGLPKCFSPAHQSSRETIPPFFQHILLKDINSPSPPCFSFYFCQLHLLQSFWTQSLKGLYRVEMVPLQHSYFKYLFHLSALCCVILLFINVMYWFTALRLLSWGGFSGCVNTQIAVLAGAENHRKPAWIPGYSVIQCICMITVFCLERLVSLNNHSLMLLPELLRNFCNL